MAGAKIAGGGRRLRWRLWLVVGSGGDREVEARALVGGRWIWEDPDEDARDWRRRRDWMDGTA